MTAIEDEALKLEDLPEEEPFVLGAKRGKAFTKKAKPELTE